MTTFDLYTMDPGVSAWDVPAAGSARFTWEYGQGRDRLLSLYQRGKDKQWDATTRIDWSLDLDPEAPFGMPRESHPLAGSRTYEKLSQAERDESGTHVGVWQFSQFLHGEQGALLCSARIVESVPDLDSKYYAATQVMDEARHVEAYSRLLQEKVGMVYPIRIRRPVFTELSPCGFILSTKPAGSLPAGTGGPVRWPSEEDRDARTLSASCARGPATRGETRFCTAR